MPRDPADRTHRKPRQTRGTPLGRYANFISLGITLLYAGMLYVSYRRNVLPLAQDDKDDTYRKKLEEIRRKDYDVDYPPFLHYISDVLFWRGDFKPKLEDPPKIDED